MNQIVPFPKPPAPLPLVTSVKLVLLSRMLLKALRENPDYAPRDLVAALAAVVEPGAKP